jgi:hypothetical protein
MAGHPPSRTSQVESGASVGPARRSVACNPERFGFFAAHCLSSISFRSVAVLSNAQHVQKSAPMLRTATTRLAGATRRTVVARVPAAFSVCSSLPSALLVAPVRCVAWCQGQIDWVVAMVCLAGAGSHALNTSTHLVTCIYISSFFVSVPLVLASPGGSRT